MIHGKFLGPPRHLFVCIDEVGRNITGGTLVVTPVKKGRTLSDLSILDNYMDLSLYGCRPPNFVVYWWSRKFRIRERKRCIVNESLRKESLEFNGRHRVGNKHAIVLHPAFPKYTQYPVSAAIEIGRRRVVNGLEYFDCDRIGFESVGEIGWIGGHKPMGCRIVNTDFWSVLQKKTCGNQKMVRTAMYLEIRKHVG